MIALTTLQWALIAALAALYVLTCVRVAWTMRRAGRNPWLWFVLTLLLTAIPATLYTFYLRFRALRPEHGEPDPAPPEDEA